MNYYQITPDIDLVSSHDEEDSDNQEVLCDDSLNNNRLGAGAASAADSDDDPNWLVISATTKQHRRNKRRQLSNGKGHKPALDAYMVTKIHYPLQPSERESFKNAIIAWQPNFIKSHVRLESSR